MTAALDVDATTVIGAALGVLGTVLVAWITTRGQRRQAREALVITKEQGATTMFDALARALQAENERKDRIIARRDERIVELERQLAELREAHEGLVSRHGTRRDDPDAPAP